MKTKIFELILNSNIEIEIDSAYFNSREIMGLVSSHRNRSLIKILNQSNGKKVIRKVRAKSLAGLDSNTILLDYLSAKELGARNGEELIIESPSIMDRYFTYYNNHPKEELRIAYRLFWLGIFISICLDIV